MTERFDVIVLGAGMAGASVAAELAPHLKVLILEMEDHPGHHATGRSAAMFFESYGNDTVRALTRASRDFLETPPDGFSDVALMTPRAGMIVADATAVGRLDHLLSDVTVAKALRRIPVEFALNTVPILRRERVAGAALDETGCAMEVAAIHHGYLRAARRAGARLLAGARDMRISRGASGWEVDSRAGHYAAEVLVNATGAWADDVARKAGAREIGLQPRRRSAVMLPVPPGLDIAAWPLVTDVDETVYFKPDGGQLMLSPANEDPMPPCDVAPEELDIAIAVDRFEALTTLSVPRLARRWAGLRSFVSDRSPVAGFDPSTPGFFWLAGQGGYGIQMAPALARAAAALLRGVKLPADIAAEGVTAEALSPTRAALQPASC